MNGHDEDYVQDLTERVFLIKRELEAGKIKIASHLVDDFRSSFEKIKIRSDGKVDPSTVDAVIRAMGAAVDHFIDRENTKNDYAIHDLQRAYFNILFSNFGNIYEAMLKNKVDPYITAEFFSRKEDYVKHVDETFQEFYDEVTEFWRVTSDIGVIHLQDGEQLKVNFSGDLFPSYSENAISIAGLYVDTITLPCPVLRVGRLHNVSTREEFARLLLKHVLTCMTYRDVALEEIEPAIVLILPDRRDFTDHKHENLIQVCEPYILSHAQYLYDRKFESLADFRDFSLSFKTIDSVFEQLKRPERLIINAEWGGDARSQLSTVLADTDRITHSFLGDHAGMEVFSSCVGRMPQAYSAKCNAQELGSTPYINAETSWIYYTWLIEYESMRFDVNNDNLKNLHMVHAMSAGMQDGFSWMGDVPINKIIELRRKGLMEEVRSVLSSGVNELININPKDYTQTSQRVIDNIDQAFIEHQRVIEKARKEKLKILGLDVAPCIINGAVAIAGALTGNVALATISAGAGMLGFPTIKDIKSKFKDRQEKMSAYQSSVTGMLFSHKK